MTVEVTIVDRKDSGYWNNDIEFETFTELDQKIDEIINDQGFRKVDVEIFPVDFEPTASQLSEIKRIENG